MSRRHIYRGRSRTGIARCTAGRIWRSVLPKSRQLQRERLLKSLGNACDRRSAKMATEEGDEDHDVETDVVEGADSLLVDEAGPCGSNEAGMLLSILRDMFEDKPSRKQTEKQRKTSRSRRERRQKPLLEKKTAEEKRRKWLKEPSTKEN